MPAGPAMPSARRAAIALACPAVSRQRSSLQQPQKLRRDEAHLGGELRALLAHELVALGELGPQEHDGLAAEQPVLGAAERQHVDAAVGRDLAQAGAERGGGVQQPGAVDVQQQPVLVRRVGRAPISSGV